jgi:hypothetical protein
MSAEEDDTGQLSREAAVQRSVSKTAAHFRVNEK